MLIKNLEIVKRYKLVYLKSKKVKDKEGFERKFQRELILYEAAAQNLKGTNPPPLETLKTENGNLSEQKKKLYEEYKKCKAKSSEIETVKSNVETLLGVSHKPNLEISAHLEQ